MNQPCNINGKGSIGGGTRKFRDGGRGLWPPRRNVKNEVVSNYKNAVVYLCRSVNSYVHHTIEHRERGRHKIKSVFAIADEQESLIGQENPQNQGTPSPEKVIWPYAEGHFNR